MTAVNAAPADARQRALLVKVKKQHPWPYRPAAGEMLAAKRLQLRGWAILNLNAGPGAAHTMEMTAEGLHADTGE